MISFPSSILSLISTLASDVPTDKPKRGPVDPIGSREQAEENFKKLKADKPQTQKAQNPNYETDYEYAVFLITLDHATAKRLGFVEPTDNSTKSIKVAVTFLHHAADFTDNDSFPSLEGSSSSTNHFHGEAVVTLPNGKTYTLTQNPLVDTAESLKFGEDHGIDKTQIGSVHLTINPKGFKRDINVSLGDGKGKTWFCFNQSSPALPTVMAHQQAFKDGNVAINYQSKYQKPRVGFRGYFSSTENLDLDNAPTEVQTIASIFTNGKINLVFSGRSESWVEIVNQQLATE